MKPDIAIADGEQWPCFVGSGECKTPAVFLTDDGRGEYIGVCAAHKKEFEALEKLIEDLPVETVRAFEKAVAEADGMTVQELYEK